MKASLGTLLVGFILIMPLSQATAANCSSVINDYLTDGKKVRRNNSALAMFKHGSGSCSWAAWSGAKSTGRAKRQALKECKRHAKGKKCKIVGVNKKIIGKIPE